MIRFGISGACGRGGRLFERIAELFDGVEVTAICDVKTDELESARERLNAKRSFADFDEMIGADIVDAVLIGTPMPFHVPQAERALASGVHVLSEVPAGVSIEECRRLVETWGTSDALYMMAENYIFSRPNTTVTNIAKAGRFGTPYYAEGEYLHELKALNEITTWRRKWQTGIDGVTYGTHSLGPLLQWFPGERVVEAMGAGSGHHYRDPRGDAYENQESSLMLCRMSGGGLIKIRVDMLSDRPHAMTNYQLQGTDGCYESARTKGEANRIWLREDESDEQGEPEKADEHLEWRTLDELEDEFLSHEWREEADFAASSGHGGGDFFVMREFFSSIREKRSPLVGMHRAMDLTLPGLVSQQSVLEGGVWMPVPDSRTWTSRVED